MFSINDFCSNQNEAIINFIRDPSNNFAKKVLKKTSNFISLNKSMLQRGTLSIGAIQLLILSNFKLVYYHNCVNIN